MTANLDNRGINNHVKYQKRMWKIRCEDRLYFTHQWPSDLVEILSEDLHSRFSHEDPEKMADLISTKPHVTTEGE